MIIKTVNNINFYLQLNPNYKRTLNKCKNNEPKYYIVYYAGFKGSYNILFSCNNKKDFTIKNIKKHLL